MTARSTEKSFPRDLDALDEICEFVEECLEQEGIRGSNVHWADFVVQELFTNMVKYSRGGRHEIAVKLRAEADRVIIEITDFDVDAFDVTKLPAVDIDQWVKEDRVGGLGIHLIRQIADTISYEYENRNSTVTVTTRVQH